MMEILHALWYINYNRFILHADERQKGVKEWNRYKRI